MKKTFILPSIFLLFVLVSKNNEVSAQENTWYCIHNGGICEVDISRTNCNFECWVPQTACYYALPPSMCADTSGECLCPAPPTGEPAPTSALDLNSLYHSIQTGNALIQLNGNTTPGYIVMQFVKLLFPFAGLIFLLILLYGGYTMMLSGGDPKKLAQAKSTLTTGLVGLIVIFTAYWIAIVIGRILGVQGIYSIFQ